MSPYLRQISGRISIAHLGMLWLALQIPVSYDTVEVDGAIEVTRVVGTVVATEELELVSVTHT